MDNPFTETAELPISNPFDVETSVEIEPEEVKNDEPAPVVANSVESQDPNVVTMSAADFFAQLKAEDEKAAPQVKTPVKQVKKKKMEATQAEPSPLVATPVQMERIEPMSPPLPTAKLPIKVNSPADATATANPDEMQLSAADFFAQLKAEDAAAQPAPKVTKKSKKKIVKKKSLETASPEEKKIFSPVKKAPLDVDSIPLAKPNFADQPLPNSANVLDVDALPMATKGAYDLNFGANAFAPGAEETESTSVDLPLVDRMKHKDWKVRQGAYEEFEKLVTADTSGFDELWAEYHSTFKKMSSDTNMTALEQGLGALEVLVDAAAKQDATSVMKVAEICVAGAVKKGLAASRASTQNKATSVLLMFLECGASSIVLPELLTAAKGRNIKFISAAVTTAKQGFLALGPEVVNLPFCCDIIPLALNHANGGIRDVGSSFCQAIFGMIGAPFTNMMNKFKVKPNLLAQIEKSFETCDKSLTPTRTLRGSNDNVDTEETKKTGARDKVFDAMAFVKPVDVIAKLPKGWKKKVMEGKRTDRLAALESFRKLCDSSAKIAKSDSLGKVVNILVMLVREINVQIVSAAIKIIGALAKGMKSLFTKQAIKVLPLLLSTFKEKKVVVSVPLRTTLDIIARDCVTLAEMSPHLQLSMDSPITKVALDTIAFVQSLVQATSAEAKGDTSPEAAALAKHLSKKLDHADAAIRKACIRCIGMLARYAGDSNTRMNALLTSLSTSQSVKYVAIIEARDAPIVSEESKKTVEAKKTSPVKKKVTAPKPAGSNNRATAPVPSKLDGEKHDAVSSSKAEGKMSEGEAWTQLLVLFPEMDLALQNLQSRDWEEVADASEEIQRIIEESVDEKVPVMDWVRPLLWIINAKPGFKPTNPKIYSEIFQLLAFTFDTAGIELTPFLALMPLSDVIAKLGDLKQAHVQTTFLLTCAECIGPASLIQEMLSALTKVKSPKAILGTITFFSQCIVEFGAASLGSELKALVTQAKSIWIVHSDAKIRKAAGNLLVTICVRVPRFSKQVFDGSLKSSITTPLQAELETVESTAPVRFHRGAVASSEKKVRSGNGAVLEVEFEEDIVDISDKINGSDIIKKLGSHGAANSWRERSSALTELQKIIESAGGPISLRTSSSVITPLVQQFQYTHKNVIKASVRVVTVLMSSLGALTEKYASDLFPGLVLVLGNPDKPTKAMAMTAMETFFKVMPMSKALWTMMLDSVQSTSTVREELLTLGMPSFVECIDRKLEFIGRRDLEASITTFVSCLLDKPKVRQLAEDLTLRIVVQLGNDDALIAATQHLPKSSALVVKPYVAKFQAALHGNDSIITSTKPQIAVGESKNATVTKKRPSTAHSRASRGRGAAAVSAPSASIPSTVDKGTLKKCDFKAKSKRLRKLSKMPTLPIKDTFNKFGKQQLKEQMLDVLEEPVVRMLFPAHDDFVQWLKGFDEMLALLNSHLDPAISILDLMLSYTALRMTETNTKVLSASISFLQQLIPKLMEIEYTLEDGEIAHVLQALVNIVSGHNAQRFRSDAKDLLMQLTNLYPVTKIFAAIVDGVDNINQKAAIECIGQVSEFLRTFGVTKFPVKSVLLKLCMKIATGKATVRDASVSAVADICVFLPLSVCDVNALWQNNAKLSKQNNAYALLRQRLRSNNIEQPAFITAVPSMESSTPLPKSKKKSVMANLETKSSVDVDEVPDVYSYGKQLQNEVGIDDDGVESFRLEDTPTVTSKFTKFATLTALLPELESATEDESVTAMKMLWQQILKDGAVSVIGSHTDHLTVWLLRQEEASISNGLVKERQYKYALNILLEIFLVPDLARHVHVSTLERLAYQLLARIVDPVVKQMDDLRKAVNNLMVQVFETADKTSSFHVLFKLLTNFYTKPNQENQEFVDLVLRCLLKFFIRAMAAPNGSSLQLNVPFVLRDIQAFLDAHVPGLYKGKEDLPLRVARVAITELYKKEGVRMQEHCMLLPPSSKLAQYVKVLAGHMPAPDVAIPADATADMQTESESTDMTTSYDVKACDHELDVIFAALHKEATTAQALKDLHAFTVAHRNHSIDKHMAACTTAFQGYIRRGLADIVRKLEASAPVKPHSDAVALNIDTMAVTHSTADSSTITSTAVPQILSQPASPQKETKIASTPAVSAPMNDTYIDTASHYRQRLNLLRNRGEALLRGSPLKASGGVNTNVANALVSPAVTTREPSSMKENEMTPAIAASVSKPRIPSDGEPLEDKPTQTLVGELQDLLDESGHEEI